MVGLTGDAAHYSVMEEEQITVRALVESADLVGMCLEQSDAPSCSNSDSLAPPGSSPATEVKHEAARLRLSAQPSESVLRGSRRKNAGGTRGTDGRGDLGNSQPESGGK